MAMRTYEALSYRDNEVGLRVYRDGLLEARAAEIVALPSPLTRVYLRRISRIAAGGAATFGFGAMALAAVVGNGFHAAFDLRVFSPPLTLILLLTVAAVPVVALIARTGAQVKLLSLVRRDLRRTSDTRADVERLERPAAVIVAEHADALETRSVAAPLVGCALIAPLTLHFVVYAFMESSHSLDPTIDDYDWWICASLLITGVAHVTLAVLGVRFAQRLRESLGAGDGRTPSVWAPLMWTILAGCVPGVVLYLVPPTLVAVTGLVFIPAAFTLMRARVRSERRVLDAWTADAPGTTALPHHDGAITQPS